MIEMVTDLGGESRLSLREVGGLLGVHIILILRAALLIDGLFPGRLRCLSDERQFGLQGCDDGLHQPSLIRHGASKRSMGAGRQRIACSVEEVFSFPGQMPLMRTSRWPIWNTVFPSMARKIAFINYKGGVGKTSLIVNTAAALVKAGKRVLVCDFDTQSNASIWLLKLDRWNKINAAGEGAVYSIFEPGKVQVRDLIIRDALEGKSGECPLPGLDLLPTSFNLVDLENEYNGDPKRPPFLVFQEQLAVVEPNYDFILFDCPPNILRASQCGIFAANEICVPANPDALSLIGFTLLVEKLHRFHTLSASFRRSSMGPPAQVQSVVFNAIKTGVDIEVPKMRMQLRLNQFRAAKRVAPNAKIFQTQIRDAMVVRRAVTLGLPVVLISQDAADPSQDNVVNDYRRMTQEMLQQVT